MASSKFKYELQELQRSIAELELREQHPLRVYRPTPQQLPIHEAGSSEVVVAGGKRCIAGWQVIYDPVLNRTTKVSDIDHDFHVESVNPVTGNVEIKRASKPFIKGYGDLYRVTFSSGEEIFTTLEHRLLTADLRWVSVREIWSNGSHVSSLCRDGQATHIATSPSSRTAPQSAEESWSSASHAPHSETATCRRTDPYYCEAARQRLSGEMQQASVSIQTSERYRQRSSSCTSQQSHLEMAAECTGFCRVPAESCGDHLPSISGSSLSVSGEGAPYYWGTAQDYWGRCFHDYRPYGERPRQVSGIAQVSSPLPGDAHGHIQSDWPEGDVADGSEHSRSCQSVSRPSRQRSLVDEGFHVAYIASTPTSVSGRRHLQSAGVFGPQRGRAGEAPQEIDQVCFALTHPRIERLGNSTDTIVTSVDFVCKGFIWDIEVPGNANYILGSTVSANSGKTLSVAMEFASRLLGIPITRDDGTKIKGRFRSPSQKNPGLYWVIGLNVDHIGQTLYHRLFSDGLGCNFRILKDKVTGEWRAYNPNTDKARYDDSRLSPPLFGDYLIKPETWHFESRAGNVFKSVQLINGVTLCAYPTTGDNPKQGDAVDGIWLDEDTANASFLKEWQDRLISVDGWFLWSVWPKVANEALIKTLDRAKKYEPDDSQAPIKVFHLIGSENTYSDKEGIAKGLARMDDDDDEAHRDRGDIDAFISGRRMYDFGDFHIIKIKATENKVSPLDIVQDYLHRNRRLPTGWTRYMAIDPSHTRTACLIGVVPPSEVEGVGMGDRLIIEQEIVLRKHTPSMFADAIRPYTDIPFEAFIMDQMMGRQTTVGSDATVFRIYEEQLRQRGIESRLTRNGFMMGSNDKAARRRTVRAFLEPRIGGLPTLLVSHRCTQTIKEFYNFRKKEVKDSSGNMLPMDDAANERVFDCMAAMEYLCQYVSERFRDGTAYVEPENRVGRGSSAYHRAQSMLQAINLRDGGSYVHFGPGEHV